MHFVYNICIKTASLPKIVKKVNLIATDARFPTKHIATVHAGAVQIILRGDLKMRKVPTLVTKE